MSTREYASYICPLVVVNEALASAMQRPDLIGTWVSVHPFFKDNVSDEDKERARHTRDKSMFNSTVMFELRNAYTKEEYAVIDQDPEELVY